MGAGENQINDGMDALIWQKARPHDRNVSAFPNPTSEVAWRAVFADGQRRLITAEELTALECWDVEEGDGAVAAMQ
jgi:hypothetical protein